MAKTLITTLLSALLVAGALAGCASDNGGDGTTTTSPGTTTTPASTTPSTTPTTTPVVTTPQLPVSGQNDVYGITTGGATGVYFAIGNGIAAAVRNATGAGFTISEVATSQGSVQNAQRLQAGDYEFATMQNDVAYYAAQGEGSFSTPIAELRAVGSLYPEMVQIVTLRDSGIDSIADLAGKRVVLGAPGSGAAVNAGQILNASGVTADTQYLDLSTAADRLKDGGVDAVFWTGGIPTGAVVSLATTHPVRVLAVDAETKAALQAEYPFYANATLPGGTYGGQSEDVETVAVMAILVARSDVAADDVMSLLRILYDGTAVQSSHAQGAKIQRENAFTGIVGLEWHEGARAYYLSHGMTVPS